MNIKKLFIVGFISVFIISCSNDDNSIIVEPEQESNIPFVFVEIERFSDYYGDQKLILSDGNETTTIFKTSSEIRYHVANSKVYYRDGSDIVEFDPATNQRRTLASLTDVSIHSFQVSPDSKFLAFSNYEDIILLDLQTRTSKNLTEGLEGDFRSPKWSPDGSSILVWNNILVVLPGDSNYTGTVNFKVFNLSEENFQNVEMFSESVSPGFPGWLSDSNTIVYGQVGSMFTFDLQTEQLQRTTLEGERTAEPKFSPNGEFISYSDIIPSQDNTTIISRLALFNLQTQTKTMVTDTNSHCTSWSKNSSEIMYCTLDGIYTYNLSTGDIIQKVESNNSDVESNAFYVLTDVNYLD